MYEEFFNLSIKPFELVPNPEFLFLSKSHKKAITYLDYGIRERVGFILLTGEIGSGKTTILRNLIKGIRDKVVLSKVFNTRVSSEQLIAMINEDFGLEVAGKERIALLRELNEYLVEQYARGNQPILIIDEAQNLSPELLEEVRLLSNLETDRSKLLQIILVGQPELRKMLNSPELRQLRQRIGVSCHIKPLSLTETGDYILHRLEKAGNRDAVSLPAETVEVIYQFSRGIPRLINIICDFLMISAFAEQSQDISVELVREVVGELEEDANYWGDEPATVPAAISAGANGIEIDSRLERVEEALVSLARQGGGSSDFIDKLTSIERNVCEIAGGLEARLTVVDSSVSSILREVKSLKEKTALLEKRNEIEPDKKRKGMLGWIAS
ncbi:MAG: ATPase [Desulfuromonadales bacterium]|nr:MAG: ATPase [Desulfuromonadales bacterium]